MRIDNIERKDTSFYLPSNSSINVIEILQEFDALLQAHGLELVVGHDEGGTIIDVGAIQQKVPYKQVNGNAQTVKVDPLNIGSKFN